LVALVQILRLLDLVSNTVHPGVVHKATQVAGALAKLAPTELYFELLRHTVEAVLQPVAGPGGTDAHRFELLRHFLLRAALGEEALPESLLIPLTAAAREAVVQYSAAPEGRLALNASELWLGVAACSAVTLLTEMSRLPDSNGKLQDLARGTWNTLLQDASVAPSQPLAPGVLQLLTAALAKAGRGTPREFEAVTFALRPFLEGPAWATMASFVLSSGLEGTHSAEPLLWLLALTHAADALTWKSAAFADAGDSREPQGLALLPESLPSENTGAVACSDFLQLLARAARIRGEESASWKNVADLLAPPPWSTTAASRDDAAPK
jgi:hypothetical protein